jgi:hypothetical protein
MLYDAILVVSELVWNPSWFRLTTGIIWAQVRKFEHFGRLFLYLCSYNLVSSVTLAMPPRSTNYDSSCYTYHAVGIKSISLPNRLVTRHRLNDHQRRIVVQGDSDHDLCTGGSYAEATVVLTSTQTSRPSKEQRTRTADSRVEVQGDGVGDHYTGGWCAHTTVLMVSTQADNLPIRQC